jgi:hypothetical protein
MVDKNASGLFPSIPVPISVIDEGVTRSAMLAFERGRRGDDLHVGEVPRSPTPLLRLCPGTARKAREDDRVEVPDGGEQLHGIRHEVEGVEEIRSSRECGPESPHSMPALEFLRRDPKDPRGATIEIREHAVAV